VASQDAVLAAERPVAEEHVVRNGEPLHSLLLGRSACLTSLIHTFLL
jgi:hypothetical protein